MSQFVGLLENFLGGSPDRNLLKQLFNFIKQGYEETEQEKLKRLTKVSCFYRFLSHCCRDVIENLDVL